MMIIPEELLYTKEHEWAKIEDNTAIVGITDFAQSQLGDIIFIEFPNIGDQFTKNEIFGEIEAVKTVSELYIPLSGKIIEINDKLEDSPEIVNSDPYVDGWIIRVELFNMDEKNNLMTASSYREII
tara:strand:+ start:2143 stop:2520 length:378 start_codon:yes stop_codon:yes gene_type:complete